MKVWTASLLILIVSAISLPAVSQDADLESELSQLETVQQNDTPTVTEKNQDKSKSTVRPEKPVESDDPLHKAESLLAKQDFDGALKILIPMTNTLARRGLLLLARAHGGKKDSANEVKTLQLCVAKFQNDYIGMDALAEALLRAKRIDESIATYQQSREMNPRYQPTYEGLLAVLELSGDRYEARSLIADMIKRFGEKPSYVAALCRLYTAEAFLDKAVESCNQAIKLDGSNPANFLNLGMALHDMENDDRALQIMTEAARRFPTSEAAQVGLAKIYVVKKNFVEAYKYYRKATDANPKSGAAWAGRATTSFELQKNEEALDSFIKACKAERQTAREFRVAIGRLRQRNDAAWRLKFENGIGQCSN